MIVPSTLKYHWLAETEKFMDKSILKCEIISSKADMLNLPQEKNFLIMSYYTATRLIEEIKRLDLCFCILDEGHKIKNDKSKFNWLCYL